MYNFIKKIVIKLFKVPPEPDDPMGDVDSLVVFRASPNFFKYKFIVWIIQSIFGAIGYIAVGGVLLAGLFSKLSGFMIILLVIGIFLLVLLYLCQLLFSYVIMKLDYEMRWYKVSDRSLRIREGVIFVREMTMTFANIQNISISQGPIQRFFKISDLRVETAGGGGGQAAAQNQQNIFSMHVGFFRGVDNSEDIRNLMLERLKNIKSTGLGDVDEKTTGQKMETPAPSAPLTHSSSLIPALNNLKDEATALRQATISVGDRRGCI
jgi:uncharacterized membrane protein YdbT with pleckstrin-like domain